MAYLYSSWRTVAITTSTKLHLRLRLTYTFTSAYSNTQSRMVVGACGVEAYTESGAVPIYIVSSNTYSTISKNYYYDFNGSQHVSYYRVSEDTALGQGSSTSPAYTALDTYSSFTYDVDRTTSTRKTTLSLFGSLRLHTTLGEGVNIDVSFGTQSSPTVSRVFTVPTLPTYAVKYNANGGSGAPSEQTKYYGVSLTLSSTKPTRTGYTFKGWGTSSSATTASYQPGGTYTSNAALTLYAIWQINTYTVTLNANGGTNGSVTSFTKTYGVTATFPTSAQSPTRSGWTFLGWSASKTATSATYTAGSNYTANAGGTFYAVWRKQLSLSYGANGGSGAPSTQTAYVYNATTSYQFTVSSTVPTRSGWTFVGWNTSSTATTSAYSSGSKITVSSSAGSVTLYAIWKRTLTLQYSANSGSGAPSTQTGTIYNSTTSKSFTISATKPTRTNYTFLGWATSSTATSASYQPSGTISVTTSNTPLTLYAVWKAVYIKPTISGLTVSRCASDGTEDDEGTYARVKFSWSGHKLAGVSKAPSSITIASRVNGSGASYTTVYSNSSISATSGTVNEIVGGSYVTSNRYDIRITIANADGDSLVSNDILTTAYFTMDINADGTVIGLFGSAPDFSSGASEDDKGLFVYKDIKLQIDTTATTGLDGALITALTNLGWTDLL